MKKLYLFPVILFLFLFTKCQSGSNQANETNAKALPVETLGSNNSAYADDQQLNQDDDDDDDGQRPEDVMKVQKFLRYFFKNDLQRDLIQPTSRQFKLQCADLNADGKDEIFVGLTGPYFCGSGGCTFLLLDHTGKLITKFTVSSYPVIVDSTFTKGWHDLLVQSQGKFHRLKFTGTRYLSNPSLAPITDFLPSKKLLSVFDSWEEKKAWHVF
ncbi:hypothetical protein SAMN06265348_113190 [Pedobacter westerhofensis]|uniref:Repeat domain-containing protein n=1 Tax=Pedobacter westerhofensis TaxID=425512 RepID=A0A521FL57_9SPHI|nr:hypothetical protein [Pedobacter westerhofensis]SMO96948.1 hypothetical protein SAMN06265348_113190 [Pedobacter westerhofensis]